MAQPGLVPKAAPDVCGTTHATAQLEHAATSPTVTGSNPPSTTETAPDGIQSLRQALRRAGVSEVATNVALQAWKPTTVAQYRTHWRRWFSFCGRGQVNPLHPSGAQLASFLGELYETGLGYSSLLTAKSAVVALVSTCADSPKLGESVIVQRFMKGVFTSRPALPRHQFTWDISTVLTFLDRLSPPKSLSLLWLSRKLAALIALLTGHRGQSVHLLSLQDVECSDTMLVIRFGKALKQTKPGLHAQEVVIPAYKSPGLCAVTTYRAYLARTKPIRSRGVSQLLLSSVKPHKAASRDTVSNWIKAVLQAAGVDMAVFASHSTRSASTSAAMQANVPIATILRTAGWASDSTFRRFYNLPVTRDTTFASAILNKIT